MVTFGLAHLIASICIVLRIYHIVASQWHAFISCDSGPNYIMPGEHMFIFANIQKWCSWHINIIALLAL